jgi:hypothetical protein
MLAVTTARVYIFVMWRLGYLQLALTCLMCVLFCSPPSSAQISRRLDRCLPYPTLADEIDDMREEVRAKIAATPGAIAPVRTVVIDKVELDQPTHLPVATRDRLVAELKQGTYRVDSGWLAEIQDASIRGAWADEGFLKAEPTAEAQVISTDKTVQHVLLTVHVNEGLQFRLGDILIRSSNPDDPLIFSSDKLRKLIHLQAGDILRAKKIREAIDGIMELYRSDGYIDAVLTPIMEMDDQNHRISLVMEVDQEKQYRVGKVEVFGPNPQVENLLKSKLRPGDVYHYWVVENFLKEHSSSLPPDVSFQDIDFHRNVKSGRMDIRFNFQSCDQLQK